MLTSQALEIALPACVQLLEPAQLAGLAQAWGPAGQLGGQGGKAGGQGLGLPVPEQQLLGKPWPQLGAHLQGQGLEGRPRLAGLHQQPGGLARRQGLQPAQVGGRKGRAQVVQQAIAGLK